MKTIGQAKILSYPDGSDQMSRMKNSEIRRLQGHLVGSYIELSKKVAALQYCNPEYVLLFRGQRSDYRNQQGNSTLKPTLFRSRRGTNRVPNQDRLERRFDLLHTAERNLVWYFERNDTGNILQRLKRHRILRWAILQHYEICRTPLLDVSHSLRVAASFASVGDNDEAFVYVLGVPNVSGSVTASAEAGLQIIRLSSVCPPSALRPHLQEGYLLGEYPDMPDFDQKQHYESYEIDFGRRLVGKFKLDPRGFRVDADFPLIQQRALYPDQHDPLARMAAQLKRNLGPQE